MTPIHRRDVMRLPLLAAAASSLPLAHAATQGTAMPDNPTRDFDFLFGSWRVRHRRLKARLKGSTEWIEFDGSSAAQPVLDGLGNVDDNVIDLPGAPYRAATLRSFDPQTKRWAIWWFDERYPHAHGVPVVGGFESGVGTFFADETFEDKPIKVRFIWSRITPTSAQWEQAFSPDGGRTWETNWLMNFARTGSAHIVPPLPERSRETPGLDSFDSHMGAWRARHRRMKERLADNTEWIEFDGSCVMQPLVGGAANMDDNVFNMPGGAFRGVSMRVFDPKTKTWAIWWLDSRYPHTLDPPMIGSFEDGVGAFFADETFNGRPIKVRFLWSNITATTRQWEQAFSPNGGRTWETNWTTHFTRTG